MVSFGELKLTLSLFEQILGYYLTVCAVWLTVKAFSVSDVDLRELARPKY